MNSLGDVEMVIPPQPNALHPSLPNEITPPMLQSRHLLFKNPIMSRSVSSLQSFLSQAKDAAKSPNGRSRTIVTGNESADLDSLSCSIVYAYLKQLQDESRTYVPLVNIPAKELKLRPEFTWLLEQVGLKPEHLTTLESLKALEQGTEFALVDHNVLTGPLQQYQSHVKAVIDHHEDEHKVAESANPRVIEKSGSCSSLVVNELKSIWEERLLSNKEASSALATLAVTPILIDTANMSSKVTDHDDKSMSFLKSVWPGFGKKEEFYDGLREAKADLDSLSLPQIFKKDYKSWSTGLGNLGISSCVKDLAWILGKAASDGSAKDQFLASVEEYVAEQNLEVWALMTAFADESGQFNRELVIWTKDEKSRERLEGSVDELTRELELEQWKGGELDIVESGLWNMAWKQKDLKSSRKQVAPLLRKLLDRKSDAHI